MLRYKKGSTFCLFLCNIKITLIFKVSVSIVRNKILKSMYKSVLQKFDFGALVFMLSVHKEIQPGKKE